MSYGVENTTHHLKGKAMDKLLAVLIVVGMVALSINTFAEDATTATDATTAADATTATDTTTDTAPAPDDVAK
jgi:hypothetical protein